MPFDVIDQDGFPVLLEERTIRATIVYDVFNTSDRQDILLPWVAGQDIASYLGDMPDDVTYGVATDKQGVLVPESLTHTTLLPDEHLIVSFTPKGGKLGSIFGMVLAIAAAVAVTLATAGAAAAAGTAIGFAGWASVAVAWVGAVSAVTQGIMAMTSKTSKPDSTAAYGIDGPKNTNDENTPVPLVYGTMRVAGNKVNIFVENVSAKDQKIYMQYVVSDGPIESISDIQINQQDVAQYNSVQTDYRLGTDSQLPMSWFSANGTDYNVGVKLTPTVSTYTTQQQVERVRLDLSWPGGLYHVSPKGNYSTTTVHIVAQYRLKGTSTWTSFASPAQWRVIDHESGSTTVAVQGLRITVLISGTSGQAQTNYDIQAQIRSSHIDSGARSTKLGAYIDNVVSSSGWSTIGADSGTFSNPVVIDSSGNPQIVAGSLMKTYEVTGLGSDEYSFQVTGGATIVKVEGFYATSLDFTQNTTTAYRASVMSPPLDRGIYEIQISRTDNESTSSSDVNSVYLTDIVQYLDEPVAYNNTAYYAVQVILGAEISSEPTCSALVKGRLVNIYDRKGGISAFVWSDNPADIVLDLLLNTNNNFAIASSRIDFAGFDDWRQFCAGNGLVFNGIFDTVTNVWDAVATVCRVGHASIVMEGMLWTVVIERAADPVMMFTQANIVKGSLSIQWTGRRDRPNLQEVQYYDAADGYKQHSVFALDDAFIATGEALVQNTTNLIGVTDVDQAQKEAWLLLNISRYVNQIITFDVPYQAMGVAVGDVFLFQHDMVVWGYEARTVGNSVDQVHLTIDAPIADTSGSWKMMVLQPVTNVAAATITDASGSDITLGSISAPIWTDADKTQPYYTPDTSMLAGSGDYYSEQIMNEQVSRVLISGVEFDVIDRTLVGSTWHFTLDRSPGSVVGRTAQILRTDTMATASVSLAAPDTSSNTQVITINGWDQNVAAIAPNMRVIFGRDQVTAKPFRVTKIGYKDDHTRSIGAIEYNASIYTDNPQPTPNYSGLTLYPSQVTDLSYVLGSDVGQGGAVNYYADVTWTRPLADTRVYTAAQVWVNRNFTDFVQEQTIVNPAQTCRIAANLGDVLQVKVVAIYTNDVVASFGVAPIISFEVVSATMVPDNIDNTTLTATGGIRLIALTWAAVAEPYIASYEVYEAPTNDLSKGYRVFIGNASSFNRTGLDPNTTAWYWIRTVSTAGTTSAWSAPVSATTSYILSSDLDADIANTAKYAKSLLDSIGQPTDVASLPDPSTYPTGAVVFNEADTKLYKKADDGTWQAMVPLVNVDTITSNAINITLTQQQIDLLKQAEQGGGLTDDQKAQIDSAIAAGNASVDQMTSFLSILTGQTINSLDNLSISSLSGQITSDQIASLAAAKLAGQLTSDQIAALEANKITGQLTSDQIAALVASKITGQLTSDQIAALAAAKISGQLTSDQIAALAANKITGQLTANQLTQAPSNNLIWDGCGQSSGGWAATSGATISSVAAGQTYGLGSDGSLAIKLTSTASLKSWQGASWAPTNTYGVAVTAGTYLEAQVLACADSSGSSVYIYFDFFDASGKNVSGYDNRPAVAVAQSSSGTSTSSYTLVSTLQQQVPSSAVWARFNIFLVGSSGTTFYVSHALAGISTATATVPMTWVNGSRPLVQASSVLGQLTDSQIAAVGAAKLTGQVTSSQIASITASQISNQLTSDQIASLTAAKISGTLSDSQIAALNANKLTGSIVSSQISSVNASAMTGQLSDSQIAGISASKLTGQVTSSQIASITASQISNQLSDSQIAALSAAKISGQITTTQITDGSISTAKVAAAAINANQIAAGAVTAEKLSVGSPSNVIGNSTFGITTKPWTYANINATSILFDVCSNQNIATLPVGAAIMSASFSKAGIVDATCQDKLTVTPGQNVCLQALCNVVAGSTAYFCVYLSFYDKTGKNLSSVIGNNVTTGGSDATDPANYSRSYIITQAPSTSAYAVALIRLGTSSSSAVTATCYVTQVAMGVVGVNVTTPPDWVPGGVTTIQGGQIAANTVTANQIAAQTITATQIAAGTITAGQIAANTITAGQIAASTITATQIAAGTITANQIAANTITANQIAAGAITATQIQAGSISADRLVANSITAAQIASQTITATQIAAGTLTAQQIAAGAITAEKLSVGSPSNILGNSTFTLTTSPWTCGTAGMSSSSFTPSATTTTTGAGLLTATLSNSTGGILDVYAPQKLQVTSGQRVMVQALVCLTSSQGYVNLYTGFIDKTNASVSGGGFSSSVSSQGSASDPSTWTKIFWTGIVPTGAVALSLTLRLGANSGVPSGTTITCYVTQVAMGTVGVNVTTPPDWVPGGVTTLSGGQIAANSITANQIAAGTITANEIKGGTITATQIAAGTITAGQIASQTITATQIASATITASQIASQTITANQIAAGTITASQIAAGTITANQIQAGSISADRLTANTITAAQIAAGTITATQVAAGTLTAQQIAAGAITAEKLAIASPSNLIWNSCGTLTAAGWGVAASGGVSDLVAPRTGYVGLSTGGLEAEGTQNSSGAYAQWVWQTNLDVVAGQRVQAQAKICADTGMGARVEVHWLNASGSEIGYVAGNTVSGGSYTVLSGYALSSLLATAPSGATAATFMIVSQDIGNTGKFSLRWTQTALGYASANATQVSDWTPGGMTSINGGQIQTGSITAGQIQAGSVSADRISANSITTAQIQAGGVNADRLVANSITANQIAASAVTATALSAGAVTARTIAAGAITADKLAVANSSNVVWNGTGLMTTAGWSTVYNASNTPNALRIDSGVYCPPGIGAMQASGTWTATSGGVTLVAWVQSMAVTPGQNVQAQACLLPFNNSTARIKLTFSDVNGNSISSVFSTTISTTGFNTSIPVLSNYVAASIITIAPASANSVAIGIEINQAGGSATSWGVNYTKVGLGYASINATTVSDWTPGGMTTIDGGQIRTNSITANQIAANTITASQIAASTITASQIAARTITASQLVSGTITANEIAAGTITAGQIAANTITSAQIAAGAITTEKLAVGTPSNVIWNTSGDVVLDGWEATAYNPNWTRSSLIFIAQQNASMKPKGEGAIFAQFNDNTTRGRDSAIDIPWTNLGSGIAVRAGDRVFFAAYVAPGNSAYVTVGITFADSGGNNVNATSFPYTGTSFVQGSVNPSSMCDLTYYTRIGTIVDVPPGAVVATPRFTVTGPSGGAAQSFAQFSRAQFGFLSSQMTDIPQFTPGGMTTISGNMIKTGTLDASRITANSITANQIAAGTITANQIAANTITANQIAANTITAGQIQAGAISTDQIAANAIRGKNLAVDDVLIAKSAQIGSLVVGTSNIVDNSVTVLAQTTSDIGSSNVNGTVQTNAAMTVNVSQDCYGIVSAQGSLSGSPANPQVNLTVTAGGITGTARGSLASTSTTIPVHLSAGNNTINATFSYNSTSSGSYSGTATLVFIGRYK